MNDPKQQSDRNDEPRDLDVPAEQAEDVRGGAKWEISEYDAAPQVGVQRLRGNLSRNGGLT